MARTLTRLLAAATLVVVASGCSAEQGPDGDAGTPSPLPAGVRSTTLEYLPDLAADVLTPTEPASGPGTATAPTSGGVPIVVLVPGGAWETADRSGLIPLAATIAAEGMVAVAITYRAGVDGATYPVPAQDVACAAGFAREQADRAGVSGGPLVLLGHSAGGHLASLAALSAVTPAADCPYDRATPDGLVGLAGVYDLAPMEFALIDFMGGPRDAALQTWDSADPVKLVAAGHAPEGLKVLLLHGDADLDVPLAQSTTFRDALEAAGRPVQLEVLPGVTHADVYQADVAGPLVVRWLEEAFPSPAPSGS